MSAIIHFYRLFNKSYLLVLYLPLSFFWALLLQTGSTWVFQATKMNGDLGYFTIKPDQMQMIEPLLVITLIPLCDLFVYPELRKIGIRRPIQKLIIGGVLLGISFSFSACLQYWIESMPVNSVCMLYQIPQYVLLSTSEAIFDVIGQTFSYTQAPESMKSVVFTLFFEKVISYQFFEKFIAK